MTTLWRSMRRKLFGETRTIPLGVAAAILLALLLQTLLPRSEWQRGGGFAFAAVLIVTVLRSLQPPKTTRRHR